MKKFVAFVVVLLLMVSIVGVSLANISNGYAGSIPSFNRIKGVWYGKRIDHPNLGYSVIIGQTNNEYITAITIYDSEDYRILLNRYHLTYESEYDVYYLTNSEDNISYRIMLNDKQLELYDMYYNTLLVKLDKQE